MFLQIIILVLLINLRLLTEKQHKISKIADFFGPEFLSLIKLIYFSCFSCDIFHVALIKRQNKLLLKHQLAQNTYQLCLILSYRYPLHAASEMGHVKVVNSLIQAGGDVNEKNGSGFTPLHLASMNGHVEVITALLAAGADKTIKNSYNITPHDYAKIRDCINAL